MFKVVMGSIHSTMGSIQLYMNMKKTKRKPFYFHFIFINFNFGHSSHHNRKFHAFFIEA